jgi:glucose/arabinose dehydrogenase
MNRFWIALIVLSLASMVVSVAQEETFTDEPTGTRYRLEEVVTANFPVGMVFAPDGRLFYNEKTTGNIRVVTTEGDLLPEPVITLPTNALQERGMLGIALSPTFEDDHFVYVMHTAEGTASDYPANRLVRFTVDEDNQAGEVEELLRVPIENGLLLHNGGNVHFSASGHLFLTLGDYGEAAHAQDLETPQGAIHRFTVTDEGLSPARGNPFGEDNSIYAYGLRNPFDFAFDPLTGNLIATENGPSCDDEINLILPGFNYGWTEDYDCPGLEPISNLPHPYRVPLLTFTPTIAPAGILFYEGEMFPEWQNDLFFCDWNFGRLHRVVLDETRTQVEETYALNLGEDQCRLDLVVGPDDAIYFGTVGTGEGKILRLVALED